MIGQPTALETPRNLPPARAGLPVGGEQIVLAGGVGTRTRPAVVADWPLIADFHFACSLKTLAGRYGRTPMLRSSEWQRLAEATSTVTLVTTREDAPQQVIALAHLLVPPPSGDQVNDPRAMVMVADRWQRHGLATALCRLMAEITRAAGHSAVRASFGSSNEGARALVHRLGRPIDPRIAGEQHGTPHTVSVRIEL